MADLFSVELEELETSHEESGALDVPDGNVLETVDHWLGELKEYFADVFKDAKATFATTVLELFANHFGEEGDNASVNLTLIDGPKSKSSSIAIIGGGPAGVHMAYTLSKAGFTNITIFEKSDRIGGKSCSIKQADGMVQEMGTCYLSPDYAEIKQLMSDYDCDAQAKVIGRTVWNPDQPSPSGVDFQRWLTDAMRKACGTKCSDFQISLRLLKECVCYIRNHHRLFGRYHGFLMAQPSTSVLEELDCTIETYLSKIDCRALMPIFSLAYTLQGYGYLESTPALYGLLWVTPKLLVGLVEQLKVRSHMPGEHRNGGAHDRSITILKDGWNTLWLKIVSDESLGIECRMNVDIAKPIVRTEDGVTITYHTRRRVQDGTTLTSLADEAKFDFLVVAAPMQNILPLLDKRDNETRLFGGLRSATFVTTLCRYEPAKKDDDMAIDSWLDNVSGKRPPFSVWSARDSHHVRHMAGELAPIKRPADQGSMVVYQYADLDCSSVDAAEKAGKEFDLHYEQHVPSGKQLKIGEIEERKAWSYFPRHSQEALTDHILWRILQSQGQYRTWYTGAYTSFESINAITDYNKMLVGAWVKELDSRDGTVPSEAT